MSQGAGGTLLWLNRAKKMSMEVDYEVGASDRDLVRMSKRREELRKRTQQPQRIRLNFCCVMRNVNLFPIKSSVKKVSP